MKKLALAAALWATTAAAQTAGVVGSPHDLSANNTTNAVYVTGSTGGTVSGTAQGQVCVFCHMPHGASAAGAPLWNRQAPTQNYTMYSSANSATFVTNGEAQPVSPGAVSLACLSCHDGATAFSSLNAAPMFDTDAAGAAVTYNFSQTNMDFAKATAGSGLTSPDIGTDLSNDHPISFTFDKTLADLKSNGTAGSTGGLNNPDATGSAGTDLVYYRGGTATKTIAAQMLFTEGGKDHQLECASCHEPHIHGSSSDATTNFPFLIKSNQNSNLCLTCHVK